MKQTVLKNVVLLLVIPSIFTGTLFSADLSPILGIFKGKNVDMQEMYDDMSELVPAVVYLEPDYTTGVKNEFASILNEELKNQMILSQTFKPVSMEKWLVSKYGNKKALSIFQLISDLKSERYPLNLSGIFKSYIYKVGKQYVIKLSVFPFEKNGYPVSSVRIVKSDSDIKKAVGYLLLDLANLISNPDGKKQHKIKLAVAPFSIDCRTLIEQKTGEFDFIATSFSNQEGVELKDSDDYFSELFSYQAQCTGLFEAANTQNISEYISEGMTSSGAFAGNADYLVRGKIILSNKLNLITLQLYNANTGKLVRTTRHMTKTLTLQNIWDFNYMFISDFSRILFDKNEVKILDYIDNRGKFFYMNGMFAGFDKISNIPIRSGKTIINTGNSLSSDYSLNPNIINERDNNDYFIFTNNDEILIYKGREGAYVWNLLEK